MSHKSNTQVSNTRVDWSDPQLESLLRRSEGWQLDNRGGYSPQDVQVYVGWSGSVGRSAVLVWERDKSVVVQTDFPIGKGEQVRVDKHLGESIRTLWGGSKSVKASATKTARRALTCIGCTFARAVRPRAKAKRGACR